MSMSFVEFAAMLAAMLAAGAAIGVATLPWSSRAPCRGENFCAQKPPKAVDEYNTGCIIPPVSQPTTRRKAP